jgi:hypothetical protein
MEVLSINPFWYARTAGGPDRQLRTKLAGSARRSPTGSPSLLQAPTSPCRAGDGGQEAAPEGAAIGGQVAVRILDPKFNPMGKAEGWACRCSSIHRACRAGKRLSGNGWLGAPSPSAGDHDRAS